jgi:hypothetical protein
MAWKLGEEHLELKLCAVGIWSNNRREPAGKERESMVIFELEPTFCVDKWRIERVGSIWVFHEPPIDGSHAGQKDQVWDVSMAGSCAGRLPDVFGQGCGEGESSSVTIARDDTG